MFTQNEDTYIPTDTGEKGVFNDKGGNTDKEKELTHYLPVMRLREREIGLGREGEEER